MAIIHSFPKFCFRMTYVISREGGVLHSNSLPMYSVGDRRQSLDLFWNLGIFFHCVCVCVCVCVCYMKPTSESFSARWELGAEWSICLPPLFHVKTSGVCCILYAPRGHASHFFPQLIGLEAWLEVKHLMDVGIVSMWQPYSLWISQHANRSKQCKQREGPNLYRGGW